VSFGVLALIVLAGLAGPLLGAGRNAFVPVVIGEILAGVIVGRTGLDAVDPTNPTMQFLGDVGFAMLMFTVGAHIPLRDPRLGASLRSGALAAGGVLLLAPLGGVAAAWFAGTGDAAVYAVILGSGSAAAVLTMISEARLTGRQALTVIGQVTIADVVTVLAIPLVLQPDRVAYAALGGALVAAGAVAVYALAHRLYRTGWAHRLRKRSKQRRWALDLRLSLLVLFTLSWLANESGTSVLLAGFGTGLLVAALGGPKRLFTQVRGLADGFFVPLFFVVLGARLQLGALIDHPSILRLTLALLLLNVAVHLLAGRLTRQRASAALIATAQLGVPAAVVTLGLRATVITAAQGAAIITAALASLATASLGTALLARQDRQVGDEGTAAGAERQAQPAAHG
jgi:Kef-type K+ transport system membrane component KefB